MVSESLAQRFLPLVTFENSHIAADYGQAAWESGLRVIEVGFRTAHAQQSVSMLRSHTQLTVVAGTLTSTQAVEEAVESGAHWGIAPNYDSELVEYAMQRSFRLVPGIATPSELGAVEKRGHLAAKVYPVSQLGGVAYLSALRAVFPSIQLIPSGGISLEEIGLYLAVPGVAAVSGSWLPSVSPELSSFDPELVSRVVANLIDLVSEVR